MTRSARIATQREGTSTSRFKWKEADIRGWAPGIPPVTLPTSYERPWCTHTPVGTVGRFWEHLKAIPESLEIGAELGIGAGFPEQQK
jgi:hypothetical protein